MVYSLLVHQLMLTLLPQMWLLPYLPLNPVFHVDAYLLQTKHSRAGRRYEQETHSSPMRCFSTTSKQQSPGLLGMKVMSSTINCLMIDSTQWLIVPSLAFMDLAQPTWSAMGVPSYSGPASYSQRFRG